MHFCMIIVLTITDPDSGSLFVIFVNLTGARFFVKCKLFRSYCLSYNFMDPGWGEGGAEFHTGRGSPPPLAPTLENGR